MADWSFQPDETFNFEKVNVILGEIEQAISDGAKSQSINFVLTATDWEGDGPYTQAVTIAAVSEDSNAIVDTAMDSTQEQEDAYAAAQIKPTAQGNGTITFTATGDKPDVDISMGVIIMG